MDWVEAQRRTTGAYVKKAWLPLIELAKHYNTFESFRQDYFGKNYHGTYWHITDNPNFVLDYTYKPRDLAWGGTGGVGLMVTTDVQCWGAVFKDLRRYIVRIELGDAIPNVDFEDVTRGFCQEIFVSNLSKVQIIRIYDWSSGLNAIWKLYHEQLPNGEELQLVYDMAHGGWSDGLG